MRHTMENQPRKLVVPTAKLDNAAARQLLRAAELAFKEGVRDLVIDLGAVRFMDSLGISALVTVLRRAPAGGRVVLASMTPYAQTLARLTHLDDVFDIFADADAAMASFAQPASPTRALGV